MAHPNKHDANIVRAATKTRYYGVRLIRKGDLKPFLAMGNGSTPQLFYWRRDAVKYKNALAEHKMKGKVVRVTAEYFFED